MFLSIDVKVIVPLICGVCPPMGGVGSVPCDGFLVGETCACVMVDEAGSCISQWQFCVK